MVDDADPHKRRLTRDEAVELLSRPLAGVFSSLSAGGWIHSVPVHFLYADDEVRFLAGARDVKTRNVERTSQGTLCVEVTDGGARTYVSLAGSATTRRPPATTDLRALDQKYARDDSAQGWDPAELAAAVMVIIAIDRWTAWTDWD
jgi:Pyridoxamine 5'-phosphate oxidase